MTKNRQIDTQTPVETFNNRGSAAAMLSQSGVVISKTGGAYRNPASIIGSSTAQNQLKTISAIRLHKGK